MNEWKLIGIHVKKHWWRYLLGIVALYAVDALNVYIPQYTGIVTDGLQNHSMDWAGIVRIAWIILGLGAAIAVGRFFWRLFIFGSARKIERQMQNDLFSHLETLSTRYYLEHKTGDLMAHFTSDLATVRMTMGPTVVTAFDATVMLILVLVKMISYVSLKLTVVAVIPLVLICFGDYVYGKKMHKAYFEKQTAFSTLTDQAQESISGIRVIKAFVQEKKELWAFAKTNAMNQDKNMRVVRMQALFMPLLDLVVGISGLFALFYGGYLALTGEITLGRFVAFQQYINMLVWPMIAAGECITQGSQGLASLKRIVTIMKEEPEIKDGDMVQDIRELKGEIDFNQLSFTYPGADHASMKDISFHVNAGETVAIIGHTGSGKSTLANLMLHLYDVGQNMIRYDGHSMYEIPLSVLRTQIAYVPQDSFLYSDSIARNIAFGKKESSQNEIEEAAKNAVIHDNIIDFPMGYETVVGERGVTLSGGQKQRTSIARAFLKDAPILILDDALSAVDTNTEEQILSNIKRIRQGKTTLIIAHRISTIQHADHICVLEDGKLAEYGTHEELIALEGIYEDIYRKQQLEAELESGDL